MGGHRFLGMKYISVVVWVDDMCYRRYGIFIFTLVTSCNTDVFGSQAPTRQALQWPINERNGVLAAPTSSFGG